MVASWLFNMSQKPPLAFVMTPEPPPPLPAHPCGIAADSAACGADAIPAMAKYARESAAAGRIAALSHVKATPIWVMAGGGDTVVSASIGRAAAELYRELGAAVVFKVVANAEHAFVPCLRHHFDPRYCARFRQRRCRVVYLDITLLDAPC